MSPTALEWVIARAADVPPSLQTVIESAVRNVAAARDVATARDVVTARDVATETDSLSDTLGDAALDCVRAALPQCEQRAAALHLLAADALMTYAFEAAAGDPQALDRLNAAYAPQRLAALTTTRGEAL